MTERDLFIAAVQLAPAERPALFDRECPNDSALRQRVEELLAAHEEAVSAFGSQGGTVGFGVSAAVSEMTAVAGSMIGGRYKLLEAIGEGGMGTVWVAEQTHPVRRKVALKLIKFGMDSKAVLARFEAERQALALMDHPNIAKVFDGGVTEQGRPFFVMEYVKGLALTAFCNRAHLTVQDRLSLFVQVCQAVQHAHQKGIIHRDLKPSNILACLYDGQAVPKVIDFGMAKAMHQPLTERTLFTAHGLMVGTPLYMSPEQAEFNNLDIDTRSDVYSLGVILYELLTGSTPLDGERFKDAALQEIIRLIKEEEPTKPSTKLSGSGSLPSIAAQRQLEPAQLSRVLRGDLDWIVMKSLEKDRTRRYNSASGLAEDILRYQAHEPVTAAKPSTMYRVQKFVRRNRPQVAVALIILALLAGGVAASTVALIRALRAEHVVREQINDLAKERDRVVAAERTAQAEKVKAQAEAYRARQQSTETLINIGDALVSTREFQTAYDRYAKAAGEIQSLGTPSARLDLSLVRLYRSSPAPLWTVTIPGGQPRAWVVLPTRNELLVASDDKQFHAIDLLTGETLRKFGDTDGSQCLAAANTPDGPLVVVGSFQYTRIIDPVTGAVLREAQDDRAMRTCALSPDGSLAASVDQRGSIVFWNPATLARIGAGQHGKLPSSIVFSHDGSLVASVCDEDTVALWEPRTGKLIRRFPESPHRAKNAQGCRCVEFSSDDKTLFCGEKFGVIAAFSVAGAPGPIRHVQEGSIDSIAVTAEGRRFIAATADGTVHVFEPEIDSSRPTLTLVDPTAQPLSAAYVGHTSLRIGRGDNGLSANDDGVAVAIDARGMVLAWPLAVPYRGGERFGSGLSISRDGLLISYNRNSTRDVRDAATGKTLKVLRQAGYSNSSAFSADSQHIYIGADNDEITAFDLMRNRCEWAIRTHDDKLWSIATSADNSVVVSGGGVARAWDARSGALLASLPGQGLGVSALAFAPVPKPMGKTSDATLSATDRRVIVGSEEGSFFADWHFGSVGSSRQVSGYRHIRGLSFSPDGTILAIADNSKSIALVDAASLQPVCFLGPVRSIAYSLQFIDPGDGPGRWAISNGRNELHVWDLSAREEKLVLDAGSSYAVNSMLSSPDGTLVFANACGRIDLTIPRRMRELARQPSAIARAELYARLGLWAWVEELLDRERAAGHDVPALLAARAHWACGNIVAAKQQFNLAVARQEAPAWYAEMCLSATEGPPTIETLPAVDRPADIVAGPVADAPLGAGVLRASDLKSLRSLIGKEVVVEGVVRSSLWSIQGKHLWIDFAGEGKTKIGLVCDISQKHRQAFDAVFGGDAANTFSAARLRIRGKLSVYSGDRAELAGWPEIILDDPAQVTIDK